MASPNDNWSKLFTHFPFKNRGIFVFLRKLQAKRESRCKFGPMRFKVLAVVSKESEPVPCQAEFQQNTLLITWPEGNQEIWQSAHCRGANIPGSLRWRLNLVNKEYPLLIWEGPEDVKQLKLWLRPTDRPVLSAFRSWWVAFVLIGVALAAGIALIWFLAPNLADYVATRIPVEYEIKLGETARREVLQSEKVDAEKSECLEQFFDQLYISEGQSDTQAKKVKLYVVDRPEFNAFALPGRTIVVFSGALEKMQQYDELMALLGHEYGHVKGRHTLKTLFRGASLYFILSVFVGDVAALGGLLIQQAETLQSLSYSRDFEREADLHALHFLCQNNTDPKAAIRLFQIMKGEEKSEAADWAMLRTHPLTAERIENARLEAEKLNCLPASRPDNLISLFQKLKNKRDF